MTLEMTNALRPGELFALRWGCFNYAESSMHLKQTVYKGNLRLWGKTKKSLCVIPLPEELATELWLWKQECPDFSPEAFIFANEDGSFLDPGNYLKRVLKRLAKNLGLPKLTFQVIRRTIATLGQTKGTVKSVQGMLRHNRTRAKRNRVTTPTGILVTRIRISHFLENIKRQLPGQGGVTKPWKQK